MEDSEKQKQESITMYTDAQIKGRRLRMVRALAGVSRQDVYNKLNIAKSTIDTWESGRVELTEKSSERIASAFKNIGIFCTKEWLLTGIGNAPRIMSKIGEQALSADIGLNSYQNNNGNIDAKNDKINLSDNKLSSVKNLPSFIDNSLKKELSFFLKLHDNALMYFLLEDFSSNLYTANTFVAGVCGNVVDMIGKVILAVLENEQMIICKLKKYDENGGIVFLNKLYQNHKVHIIKAAEIIWIRKYA